MIMLIVIVSIDRMYNKFTVLVGFIPKSFSPESIGFHHIRVKLLYFFHQYIKLCVNVWLGFAVVRNKIDYAHDMFK